MPSWLKTLANVVTLGVIPLVEALTRKKSDVPPKPYTGPSVNDKVGPELQAMVRELRERAAAKRRGDDN